jgi:zinc/manganese transport system substrate-binding protein
MIARRSFLLAGAAALFATQATAANTQQGKIKAVTSFSILGDLLRNVGGDRVEVETLVGPNGDVHVYSPTPGDARKLAAAKVVFVNGLGLEGWMTRLVAASNAKAPMFVVSKGIAPRQMEEQEKSGRPTAIDPHAWQSVADVKIYVANIRDGLIAVDPAGKAAYDANAQTYLAKLDKLENVVRAAIANIPAGRRKIITTHDAFGYFGAAYGMAFIAPEGVSTEAEPSAKDIAKIITQIRKQKIPAVFLESISDPRLMDQIARETGAAVGGTLYSDALSEPGGPAATYIDMMRYNIRQFTKALIG